jgi:hypothetical protein
MDFRRHSPFALLGGCVTRIHARADKNNPVFLCVTSHNPYKAQYILAVLSDTLKERFRRLNLQYRSIHFRNSTHTKWMRTFLIIRQLAWIIHELRLL